MCAGREIVAIANGRIPLLKDITRHTCMAASGHMPSQSVSYIASARTGVRLFELHAPVLVYAQKALVVSYAEMLRWCLSSPAVHYIYIYIYIYMYICIYTAMGHNN
jgi:hypothetical protein